MVQCIFLPSESQKLATGDENVALLLQRDVCPDLSRTDPSLWQKEFQKIIASYPRAIAYLWKGTSAEAVTFSKRPKLESCQHSFTPERCKILTKFYKKSVALSAAEKSLAEKEKIATEKNKALAEKIAAIEKSIATKEKLIQHYSLATTLVEKKDWNGAIAEYQEILKLNPQDPDIHVALAEVLHRRGDCGAAIIELKKALEINPQHERAQSVLKHVLDKVKIGGFFCSDFL